MDNNFNNPYQQNQQNNPYQQTNQYQPYQQPYTPYQPELEEPVSLGDWIGSFLLITFVPCVGLIVCIIWAFSKNTKKSKSNFCKAYLIVMLINIALSIIIAIAFSGVIASVLSNLAYL